MRISSVSRFTSTSMAYNVSSALAAMQVPRASRLDPVEPVTPVPPVRARSGAAVRQTIGGVSRHMALQWINDQRGMHGPTVRASAPVGALAPTLDPSPDRPPREGAKAGPWTPAQMRNARYAVLRGSRWPQ